MVDVVREKTQPWGESVSGPGGEKPFAADTTVW
jgi:hypothetical protein